jgi:hypothetical protein
MVKVASYQNEIQRYDRSNDAAYLAKLIKKTSALANLSGYSGHFSKLYYSGIFEDTTGTLWNDLSLPK